MWWLSRRLRLDHEFLADRRAALAFGPIDRYASSLVSIAAGSAEMSVQAVPVRSAHPRAAHAGPASLLIERVLMLLRCPFAVEMHSPWWWRWSLTCATIAATLAAATLSLGNPARLTRLVTRGQPFHSPLREPAGVLPRVFDVERLVLEPRAGTAGFAQPFELPVRIPEHFELTLDVWANPPALALMRVAGLALRAAEATSTAIDRADLEAWHHVRLIRDGDGLRLWVDDQPINVAAQDVSAAQDFLCVQPAPNTIGRFEHLKLVW